MARIVRVEIRMVTLAPQVRRVDAIQSFVAQETPFVTITDSEEMSGTGYSYTIGSGGPAIVSLLRETLAPLLIGREAEEIERTWRDLLFATHATAVGAITSLALAAVDTALWDLRCRRAGLPLWRLAGPARCRLNRVRPLSNSGVSGEFRYLGASFFSASRIRAAKPITRPRGSCSGMVKRSRNRS